MSNRIDALFRGKEIAKRKTLIVSIPAESQNPDALAESFIKLERAGADLIEVRISDSDEANVPMTFAAAGRLRAESRSPLVFYLSAGAVSRQGAHAFFARCAEVGVDGVIAADLPNGRGAEFAYAAREFGVRFIRPLDPAFGDFVAQIARESEGYLRCVLPPEELAAQQAGLQELLQRVRRTTRTPVALGLASTPEQARRIRGLAEAVVLELPVAGSAALSGAKNADPAEVDFIQVIKAALDT